MLTIDGRGCSIPYYVGNMDNIPDKQYFPDLDQELDHLNISRGSLERTIRESLIDSVSEPIRERRRVAVVGSKSHQWACPQLAVFVSK